MKNLTLAIAVTALSLAALPASAFTISLFGDGVTISTSKGSGTSACIRKDGNGGCIRLPSKNRK